MLSADEVIVELESRGAALVAVGDRLRVEAPVGAIDSTLDEALKARKTEILKLIRRRNDAEVGIKASRPEAGGRERIEPTMDQALAGLARGTAAVRLFSQVLGIEVWLAPDEAIAGEIEAEKDGRPVFTVDEVGVLEGMLAADLKSVADVKRAFPGSRVRAFRHRHE